MGHGTKFKKASSMMRWNPWRYSYKARLYCIINHRIIFFNK